MDNFPLFHDLSGAFHTLDFSLLLERLSSLFLWCCLLRFYSYLLGAASLSPVLAPLSLSILNVGVPWGSAWHSSSHITPLPPITSIPVTPINTCNVYFQPRPLYWKSRSISTTAYCALPFWFPTGTPNQYYHLPPNLFLLYSLSQRMAPPFTQMTKRELYGLSLI